jgi:hypothetical protein
LDQETLEKLARIKEKIQISDKVEDSIKSKGNYKDYSLSEKYLSPNLLRYFAEDIMKNLEPANHDDIKIRDPRTSLRITENREEKMQIIKNKTQIEKISEANNCAFKLCYRNLNQNFEYQIKFNKNKCDFIFEFVFPSRDSKANNLFPEEVQLAMFEKLIENFPEVLDKLHQVSKINLKQSEVINNHSLFIISKYLHLKSLQDRREEKPLARVPNDHKTLLYSTPNQSNSDNFLNQLTEKYGLEQKNKTPPKVVCNFTWGISIKQSVMR